MISEKKNTSTHGAEIRAVTLLCDTGNDTQCTTPARSVTDRECRPSSADLEWRRLGLVYGNLDARGRVVDVDCLRNINASTLHYNIDIGEHPCLCVGKTGVLVRVEITEVTLSRRRASGGCYAKQPGLTYGFGGEYRALWDLLHEEGVVVL